MPTSILGAKLGLPSLLFVLVAAAAPPPAAARQCLSLAAPPEQSREACRQALAGALPAEWIVPVRTSLIRLLAAEPRWDEVIAGYRELAEIFPQDAAWPTRQGAALLLGAGQPAEAESALREALRRDPRRAEAWALLGSTLASRQRFSDAVTAFEQAQSLEPGFLDARPALLEVLAAARRGQSWP
jgi:cytochrome c-type biogenesis protein CcmH/NrfG